MPFGKKPRKYSIEGKDEDLIRDDLYEACRTGKTEWLNVILGQPEDMFDLNEITEDEKGQQGLSALHLAARHNQAECLEILLEHGAYVDIEDRFGFRPIHDTALYGYDNCLKLLLSNGASTGGANGSEVQHVTPLHYAMQQNHKECIKLLKGSSMAQNNDEMAWDMASKRGNVSMISLAAQEALINKSISNWLKNSALTGHTNYLDKIKTAINRKFGSREALNTIITASQHGQTDYIRKLIEQGVDVNSTNKEGNTPLHFASRYGHEDTIKLLVDSGADLDKLNQEKYSAFHIAIRQGCMDGITKLLECGQNVNQRGGIQEETPLHMCLTLGVEDEVMKEILKNNPDLTLRNKDGKLPTETKCEFVELTNLVLEHARN